MRASSGSGHRTVFPAGSIKSKLRVGPKAKKTEVKINYWVYTEIKIFPTRKETINKMKT